MTALTGGSGPADHRPARHRLRTALSRRHASATLRRAFLSVSALTAFLALGVPSALAQDGIDPGEPPSTTIPAPPIEPAPPVTGPPAPAEPAPADSPPPAPSPSDPGPPAAEPSVPAPVPPEPSVPTATDRPAEKPSATTTPPPVADAPQMPRPDGGGSTPGELGPEGPVEDTVAVARNRNTVFQVVWQVQRGCRNNCHGTTQSQSAGQWSSTTQTATGIARGREPASSEASPAAAAAFNESVTVQFVWQLQIGCVAFCWETSQTQSASQWAQTIQTAVAEGDLEAWAQNLSETLQYVWQIQEGCRHECHGASQSQTAGQAQSTRQSSTAEAGNDAPVTTLVFGPNGVVVLPGWLMALAENHGATIQTLYQYQEAVCLEYCTGDVQLQEAIQEALTSQEAIAIAVMGPEDPEEPSGSQPPPPQPPATAPDAPASEQPVDQPRQRAAGRFDHAGRRGAGAAGRARNACLGSPRAPGSPEGLDRVRPPIARLGAVAGGRRWLPWLRGDRGPNRVSVRIVDSHRPGRVRFGHLRPGLPAVERHRVLPPVPDRTADRGAGDDRSARTLLGRVI